MPIARYLAPKKVTPADVQYVDIGGLGNGARPSDGLPPALLSYIKGADALLRVVRAFTDETVPHPSGATGLERDVVALCGKVEAELAHMDDGDARVFMDDLGISAPARERVIAASYQLPGLISFLTVGPDEVRAWTIRHGTSALEAGGAIHSDIQRAFIRAEVVAYAKLVKSGSMSEAKKGGAVRIEGKHYIVQDHDVCNFLFNV
ncbi:MAG: redox-regulated ATPase YchF [Nitrospinae bacterium]|nr:redox-regulated ATPase YchF [Nitrospinota bacterium]